MRECDHLLFLAVGRNGTRRTFLFPVQLRLPLMMKCFVSFFAVSVLTIHAMAEVQVRTDFEGGSARIEGIDEAKRVIHLVPGGDPQRGWPCWWYLSVDGISKDAQWTLDVGGSERPARNNGEETNRPLSAVWAMPLSAAISTDGRTWTQTKPGVRQGERTTYEVIGTGSRLWLAWGPPFTPRDTDELLAASAKSLPGVKAFELAKTREGRVVKGLHIAESKLAKPFGVWIQARQHAWESGASWVSRGVTEWITSDNAEAQMLRSQAEIFIVPIMDVDNVATGNGGKEASPRDHNRDWAEQPVYPEVAAAQQKLRWLVKEGRLNVFLDLHNPAAGDRRPFFFVGPEEMLSAEGKANRARFIAAAVAHINGPLPVEPEVRTTGGAYHPLFRQISGVWVDTHGNPNTVAACLETSWNTPFSNTEGYRTVGRQLAQSIADYLRSEK